MKRYTLKLIAGLMLSWGALQGQTPKLFSSVQSPNAAIFKAGVESSVTLDVGKVGVNIPLYTVTDKDLQIPLTLTYNSSGVKPDVHPGWVGQNWNLSAGMITRNIRGIPDEAYWRNNFYLTIDGQNTGSNILFPGYAYNFATNAGSAWNTNTKITDLAKDGSTPNTYWKEAEPDEYVFSCGSYSGKFYISADGLIRVEGQPDIKVEGAMIYEIPYGFNPSLPLNLNNSQTYTSVHVWTYVDGYPIYSYDRCYTARIMGFKITTPDGLVYEFGKFGQQYNGADTFDELEFTADIYDQYYFSEVFTTWYMTKVSSPVSNESIKLVYERGYPILQTGVGFGYYKMQGSAPARGFGGWLFGGTSAYSEQAQVDFPGKFIRPTYLKYIETSDTRIDFFTSPTTELKYNYLPIVYSILDRSRYYDPNYEAPGWENRIMIMDDMFLNSGPISNPYFVQVGPEQYLLFRADGWVELLNFAYLAWEKLDRIGIKPKGASAYTRQINFNYTNNPSKRLQLLSLTDSNGPKPYGFVYDNSTTLPGYNSMKIDHWGYHNNRNGVPDLGNPSTFPGYKDIREPDNAYLYAEMLNKVTYPTGGSKEFTYEPNKYKIIASRYPFTGEFYKNVLSTEKSGGGLRIKQIKEVPGNGLPDMTTLYEYGDGLLNGDIQYYWPSYEGRLFNGNTYYSDRFVSESLIPAIENTAGGIVSYEKVTERQTGLGRKEYDFLGFTASPDVHGNSIDPQKSAYSPFSSKSLERGMISEMRTYDNNTVLPLVKETYTYQANPGWAAMEARAVQSRPLRLFGTTEVNAVEGTAYTHYLYPFQKRTKQTQVLDKATNTYLTTSDEYTYDNDASYNDNQLKVIKTTNSDGSITTARYKHTWDYTTGGLGTAYPESSALNDMYNKRIINKVVSSDVSFKKTPASPELITAANLNTFTYDGRAYKIYNLETDQPVTSYTHTISPSTFSPDSRFKVNTVFNTYNYYGNPEEIQDAAGNKQAYLWTNNGRFALATVLNASLNEIDYTSFEDPDQGNTWSLSGVVIDDATAPSGKRAFNLGSGFINRAINSTKPYVLTYWVKGSTLPVMNGTITTIPARSGAIRSYNGWTQYKLTFTTASGFTLNGNGAVIDDIRLHPEGALMTTYTYDSQLGVTSKTDEKGAVTYYDYDSSQRLKAIRDQQGNIIKSYEYNYQH